MVSEILGYPHCLIPSDFASREREGSMDGCPRSNKEPYFKKCQSLSVLKVFKLFIGF